MAAQDHQDVVHAPHAFDVVLRQLDVEAFIECSDQGQRTERVPAGYLLARRGRADSTRSLFENLGNPGERVLRDHGLVSEDGAGAVQVTIAP